MGTRSLTYIYQDKQEDAGLPLLCIYKQYDGYVSGLGITLAEFINSGKLVNGLGANDSRVFNGMGCFAAQLVSHLKGETAGDVYLQAPILGVNSWQEYEYHIFENAVEVYEGQLRNGTKIFDGTWAEFLDFCKKEVNE